MNRLNLSLRRKFPVDAAIDLGIALETLYVSDLPRDATIGFTLRVRASRYLSTGKTERKQVFRALRQLYKLRSRAAHTGEIPVVVDGIPASEVLGECSRLAAQTISRFVRYGEPDWTDVVLG